MLYGVNMAAFCSGLRANIGVITEADLDMPISKS